MIDVYFVEDCPVYVVVFDVLGHVGKLSLGNIVISVFGHSNKFSFGCLKSLSKHRLKRKDIWQFHDVSDSSLNLCQAEITTLIVIKLSPIVIHLFLILRTAGIRKLIVDNINNHVLMFF